MAERAYFLIKLEDGNEQEEFVEKVLSMKEEQGEVESIDPVIGEYDFVTAIESELGPEEIEENLKNNFSEIKEITTLKVVGLERKVKSSEEKLREMMAE